MSSARYYDQMAPFWDFIADLQERGPANPWLGRRGPANRGVRAANRGENTENNEVLNLWTAGAMPHRHRHGHAHGPGRRMGRRHQHAEAAAQDEQPAVATTETEKVPEKVTVETLQSEAEKVQPAEETLNAPTGRRGGRGGRGGRGQGLGRARRLAAARGLQQDAQPTEPIVIQSDSENTLSGDESQRGPRAGRGGRGGRGMERGANRGNGPNARRGMGQGPRRGGMGRNGNQAVPVDLIGRLHHGPAGPHFHGFGPYLGGFGPHFGGFGPHFGMRGGPGGMRGRGAMRARNLALAYGMYPMAFGPAHHQAHAGRPGNGRGRPGMGRGAAAVGRGLNQQFAVGPNGAALRPRNGPVARRQNQGPAKNANQPAKSAVGPNQKRNANKNKKANGVFHPKVDVFNHPEAFVIDMSLPGAKKDAIDVSWNAERSVLIVSGRIERPGAEGEKYDEAFFKDFLIHERVLGPFKRRVKLGTKARPAQVDAERISAELENGVLRIGLPKLDDGFVPVKQVDVK